MGVVQICRRTQRFSESGEAARPQTPEFCAGRRCARQIFASSTGSSSRCQAPALRAVCAKPQLFPSPSSAWLSIGCCCSVSAHLPRRGRLFVVIDSSASRSRHPGVPSSPVLPCDNPNTMIDLDDKENQSPLRLGFGKSPSPNKSRSKNTAPASQDVSDAPSKQSPSQPLALVACSSSPIADLVVFSVSSSICSQVHPPLQTR